MAEQSVYLSARYSETTKEKGNCHHQPAVFFFFSCLTTTNTQGGCVRPNRVLWRHHVGGCPYHKYSLLTKIRLFGTGSYLTLTRAGQIISTCSGVPRNALSRGVVRGKENRDLIDARRATDHKNNVYWNVVAKMQCQWKTACHENDRETERTFTLPRNFGTFYLKNKKKYVIWSDVKCSDVNSLHIAIKCAMEKVLALYRVFNIARWIFHITLTYASNARINVYRVRIEKSNGD